MCHTRFLLASAEGRKNLDDQDNNHLVQSIKRTEPKKPTKKQNVPASPDSEETPQNPDENSSSPTQKVPVKKLFNRVQRALQSEQDEVVVDV